MTDTSDTVGWNVLAPIAAAVVTGLFVWVSGATRTWLLERAARRNTAIYQLLDLGRALMLYNRATTYYRGNGTTVDEYEPKHRQVRAVLLNDLKTMRRDTASALKEIAAETPCVASQIKRRLWQLETLLQGRVRTMRDYGPEIYKEWADEVDCLLDDIETEIETAVRRVSGGRIRKMRRAVDALLQERKTTASQFFAGMDEQRSTKNKMDRMDFARAVYVSFRKKDRYHSLIRSVFVPAWAKYRETEGGDADEVFRRTLTEVLIDDAGVNHGDAHEYASKVLADVKKIAREEAGRGERRQPTE